MNIQSVSFSRGAPIILCACLCAASKKNVCLKGLNILENRTHTKKNVARCSAISFSADIERQVAPRVRFHKAVSKDSDLTLPFFSQLVIQKECYFIYFLSVKANLKRKKENTGLEYGLKRMLSHAS